MRLEFKALGKITVITPSIRLEGLKLVYSALKYQDFKEFCWVICSPQNPEFKDPDFNIVWLEDSFEGGYWSLNRAYNKMFKHCITDLIVSWQDFVWADSKALRKFYEAYTKTGGLISGVGDQYATLNSYGEPTVKIWQDPRKTHKYGSFYECTFPDIEFNFCAIPKKAVSDAGGFDEMLDFKGFGGDQLQFCERLEDLGWKFYIDQTNESYTLRHGREDFGGEEEWNGNHVLFNGRYEERKLELKQQGKWPVLDYLS